MNTGIICVFALEDRDTWNETADLFYNLYKIAMHCFPPQKNMLTTP